MGKPTSPPTRPPPKGARAGLRNLLSVAEENRNRPRYSAGAATVKNVAKVKGVRKGKPRKKRRPKTTPLETAKLRIAWVTLASKVVVFLGSIVGLAAAIVGLVTLLVRLQVGGDRPRPDDRHAPLQKLEVVEVAD